MPDGQRRSASGGVNGCYDEGEDSGFKQAAMNDGRVKAQPRGRSLKVLLVTAIVAAHSPDSAAQGSGTIVCESAGNTFERCTANTEGSVRLLRQISSVNCVQGENWGYDPRSIWVDKGCRAEFSFGANAAPSPVFPAGAGGNTIVCESEFRQYRYCPAATGGAASIKRQLSPTACVQGQNWGYDRNGVWVSDNCRAEFSIGATWNPAVGADYAGAVTCESVRSEYKYCPADTQSNVRVSEEFSRSACVLGQTWGYDRNGVWVQGGCRAAFAYGRASQAQGGTPQTSIRCESQREEFKYCPASTRSLVRIAAEHSRSACVLGRTWGYDRNGIWVQGGCRATFAYGDGTTGTGYSSAAPATAIPDWLVGSFRGYNPLYDAGVQLDIAASGAVTGFLRGDRISGRYENGKLLVEGVQYTVREETDGFRTIQDSDPDNQVIYTRTR